MNTSIFAPQATARYTGGPSCCLSSRRIAPPPRSPFRETTAAPTTIVAAFSRAAGEAVAPPRPLTVCQVTCPDCSDRIVSRTAAVGGDRPPLGWVEFPSASAPNFQSLSGLGDRTSAGPAWPPPSTRPAAGARSTPPRSSEVCGWRIPGGPEALLWVLRVGFLCGPLYPRMLRRRGVDAAAHPVRQLPRGSAHNPPRQSPGSDPGRRHGGRARGRGRAPVAIPPLDGRQSLPPPFRFTAATSACGRPFPRGSGTRPWWSSTPAMCGFSSRCAPGVGIPGRAIATPLRLRCGLRFHCGLKI